MGHFRHMNCRTGLVGEIHQCDIMKPPGFRSGVRYQRSALYLSSDFVIDYVIDKLVGNSNCVGLLVHCLNIFNTNHEAMSPLTTCILDGVGLLRDKIF